MPRRLVSFRRVRVPGGFFLVSQPVDYGEDGFTLLRIGIDGQRLLGFFGGFGVVVVLQGQPRQQFLRFKQLGIGFERLLRHGFGAAVIILRRH